MIDGLQFVRSDPERALAQADAFAEAGRIEDAETLYRALLAAYPNNAGLLNALALTVKARGQMGEAERLLRAAVTFAPGEAAYHNNLGNVLRANGKPADAANALRRAIALKPVYADAHYNLGVALEAAAEQEAALAAFRSAVSLRGDYAAALTRIGAILNERGAREDALAALDAALVARPDYFDALYYRGRVLAALERYDEALVALRRAAALKPERAEARLAIANTLRDSGRLDEALEAFWRVMQSDPSRVATHSEITRLAHMLGRDALGTGSFAYARKRIGDDPDLLFAEAQFRSRLEEYGEAESLLRRAHAIAPKRGDIAEFLGSTLARQKRFAEAASFFHAAIAVEPAIVFHRHRFAVALLSAGDAEKAYEVLTDARAHAPHDQLTLSVLALALRALGDERYRQLVDHARHVRIYDLPRPGGVSEAEFNQALAQELDRIHFGKAEPIEQTLRGGTQTMGNLFTRTSDLVRQLRIRIDEAVTDYIRALPDDPAHPLFMPKSEGFSYSGSWSCRLRSAGFHTNHVHPLGRISSAYYVRLPGAVDDDAARQGWLTFGESNLGLGATDRRERFVRPETGQLVLFPSYYWHGTTPYWHGTTPFTAAEDRLTVAFDVVPGTG